MQIFQIETNNADGHGYALCVAHGNYSSNNKNTQLYEYYWKLMK